MTFKVGHSQLHSQFEPSCMRPCLKTKQKQKQGKKEVRKAIRRKSVGLESRSVWRITAGPGLCRPKVKYREAAEMKATARHHSRRQRPLHKQ